MFCIICERQLEEVSTDSDGQPCNGGHVKFTFCYGSGKFDNAIGSTTFDGYICDYCAKKYVDKMKERRYGFNGEELLDGDFENGCSFLFAF